MQFKLLSANRERRAIQIIYSKRETTCNSSHIKINRRKTTCRSNHLVQNINKRKTTCNSNHIRINRRETTCNSNHFASITKSMNHDDKKSHHKMWISNVFKLRSMIKKININITTIATSIIYSIIWQKIYWKWFVRIYWFNNKQKFNVKKWRHLNLFKKSSTNFIFKHLHIRHKNRFCKSFTT